MTTKEKLAAAAAEAQSALEAEQNDLDTKIETTETAIRGAKSRSHADQDVLLAELNELRREKHDREIGEAAEQMAQSVAAGVKAVQNEEQLRIQRIVEEKVAAALGADFVAQGGVKGLVAGAVSGLQLGRKTPLAMPSESDDEGTFRGAPAVIHSRGEKGNFQQFMFAVARRDDRAIADMQRSAGIVGGMGYGHKSVVTGLIEGAGAGSSVSGPSGGYLVPPEYSSELIPFLYPYVLVRRAGAKIQTLTSPQFYRPRLSAGATASYVGENSAITASEQSFDQFSLNLKELAALVPVSNLLLSDSDPSVKDILLADLAEQIGLVEDLQFLTGTGSSVAPTGIFNASGITSLAPTATTTGDAASYNQVVNLMDQLDEANVPERNRVFIGNNKIKAALRRVVDGNQRPIFAEYWDVQQSSLNVPAPLGNNMPKATLMGYPFFTSTQVATTLAGNGSTVTSDLAYVEMAEVIIGQMAGMEIAASADATYVSGGSTISAFQNNMTLFRAIMRHDIALSHGGAVAIQHGIQV